MAKVEVAFEEKFNVETINKGNYEKLIVELRKRLGSISKRYSHRRPVLPIQEGERPSRWFDIVLQTKDHAIRLRIRLGNLYLDGYQIENTQQWFELGEFNPRLFPKSKGLGFKVDYNSLEGAASKKKIRDKGDASPEITLGQKDLFNVVNQLATKTDGYEHLTARSLIIVIHMFCESIRFIPISNHLTTTFLKSTKILPWMEKLEHSWGELSDLMLRADANPDPNHGRGLTLTHDTIKIPLKVMSDWDPDTPVKKRIPPDEPDKAIRSDWDAAEVIGILLGLPIPGSASKRASSSKAVND